MGPLGIVIAVASAIACGIVWLVAALGNEAMVLWFLFHWNEKPPRPGKRKGRGRP